MIQKTKTLNLFMLVAMFLLSQATSAQRPAARLSAGMPSPSFSLQVYEANNPRPTLKTLESYKGRWLVVEFWTKTCASCIEGFPKLQTLKKVLSGQMDFLLVGKNDKKYNSGIREMYQRIAVQENLSLAIAYDTLAFKTFGVWATPNAVVISPNGTIASISVGSELNLESLTALMQGNAGEIAQLNAPIMALQHSEKRLIVDSTSLIPHNSELAPWNAGLANTGSKTISENYKNGIFLTGMSSLSQLYMLAHIGQSDWPSGSEIYGKFWPRPLLEIPDTAEFASSYQRAIGLYRYRMETAGKDLNEKSLMLAMQGDLRQWFGYEVILEKRKMPVLKLVCIGENTRDKLRSKTATSSVSGDHSRLELRNVPISQLLNTIWSYHQKNIILDETGITTAIDLNLDASLASLSSLANALQKNGLDLIWATYEMQVLVIRKPNP